VIMGSTMGTADEFAAMVALINAHKIVPIVDSVYDLKDGNAALQRMDEGGQFGKIVLAIP
jgi:zinc-binding alcohol dehydrogenase/oxidoreductase